MPHNGSTLEGGRKGGRRGTVRWGTPDRCWHEVLPVTRRPSLRASSETPPASPPSKTREVVVVRMPVPLREGKRGAAAGRGRGRWVDDVWLMTGPASTPSHRCRRGGKVAMGAVPMPDSDYFNADKGACAASPLFSLCCCCDAVAGAVWGLPLPLLRCVRRKPAERHFAFPVPQRAARIRRFPVFQHTHGAVTPCTPLRWPSACRSSAWTSSRPCTRPPTAPTTSRRAAAVHDNHTIVFRPSLLRCDVPRYNQGSVAGARPERHPLAVNAG